VIFFGDFLGSLCAPAIFYFLQGKHTGKENSVACQAVQRLRLDPTQENPDQFSTQETSPHNKHWSDPVEPSFADDVEMPPTQMI
jgi:condensin-2 complex subunit H2